MLKFRLYLFLWSLITTLSITLSIPTLVAAHSEESTDKTDAAVTVTTPDSLVAVPQVIEVTQVKKPWLSHRSVHYLQLLLIIGGTVAVIWRVRQIESLRRQGLLQDK